MENTDKGAASKNWDKLTGGNISEHSRIANEYTDADVGGLSASTSHGGCAAVYNGLTIDVRGRVIACPASTKTEVGNINNSSITEMINKTRENAEKMGSPPCIARDVLIGQTAPSEHDGVMGPHLKTPIIQQKRKK